MPLRARGELICINEKVIQGGYVAPSFLNHIATQGESMAAVMPAPAQSRLLMSGNEAVSRAVWESGVKVAAAYPGTPATEMLEVIATYPDLYAEWAVNEKTSLEIAFGAAMAGSRSFCAMKHVGLNVASDALMTLTLTGSTTCR